MKTIVSFFRIFLLVLIIEIVNVESFSRSIRPTLQSNHIAIINPKVTFKLLQNNILEWFSTKNIAPLILSSVLFISVDSAFAGDETAGASIGVISRSQVGLNKPKIDIENNEPRVTDICWLDVSLQERQDENSNFFSKFSTDTTSNLNSKSEQVENRQRLDIALYGDLLPHTVLNFVSLAKNIPGYGYKGSDIFRVISDFSVQAGDIHLSSDGVKLSPSVRGREGLSADGKPFPAENFMISHQNRGGGVVSMMKDSKQLQDSRFFITLSDDASWADDKYSAFGRVKNKEGMEFLKAASVTIPVQPPSNYPLTRIRIVDSGCY